MSSTTPTISFRAQGNRQNQTGSVLGRMGKKILISYRIQSGEPRERWMSASRYDLETLSVPFEDLPRYVAPVCKAQPAEAERWEAGPLTRNWFCWNCGGTHTAEREWAPTSGDLGASYARTLEIADLGVEAENDERRGYNQERSSRFFEMKPLTSTLYPTLEAFQAASKDKWISLPTDQVPEWPGQMAEYRVGEAGEFLVYRISRVQSLKAEPRLA